MFGLDFDCIEMVDRRTKYQGRYELQFIMLTDGIHIKIQKWTSDFDMLLSWLPESHNTLVLIAPTSTSVIFNAVQMGEQTLGEVGN